MNAAVTVIGWLAAATLGGWLAWWAVRHPSGMDNDPLTATLGAILLLAWMVGAIVVWWSPWFAALAFALAAALTLIPEHALPVPSLLVAVSAALALWSLLGDLMSVLNRSRQAPADADSHPTVPEEQPIALQRCVICQAPTEATICAACSAALGPHADAWLTGADTAVGRPVPSRHVDEPHHER